MSLKATSNDAASLGTAGLGCLAWQLWQRPLPPPLNKMQLKGMSILGHHIYQL